MDSSAQKPLWIDSIPLWMLLLGVVFLGTAPALQFVISGQLELLVPTSAHLVEKLVMLFDGALTKPIDIFDLCLHGLFPVLLIVRLTRMAMGKGVRPETGGS